MTATVNLTDPIQRGDTLSFEFNWDNGHAQNPQPIDMRNKTLILSFKLSNLMEDSEAQVKVSLTTGPDDVVAEAGRVVMTVSRTESQNLIAGAVHYYALRVLEASGDDVVEVTHVQGSVPVVDA